MAKKARRKGRGAGLRVAGGTAAGAAAGSLLGPLGAAVGAVVGGVAAMNATKAAKLKPGPASARRSMANTARGKKTPKRGQSSQRKK